MERDYAQDKKTHFDGYAGNHRSGGGTGKNEGTSISSMFSNFIMAKSRMSGKHESPRDRMIGPITKSLTGIVKLPDDFDEKDFMGQVFAEKYGLK